MQFSGEMRFHGLISMKLIDRSSFCVVVIFISTVMNWKNSVNRRISRRLLELYIALEALKAAGSTDPAKVLEVLPDLTYTGVTGPIAFDEIGDAVRDTAYIKTADTANGTWVLETVQTGSAS